MISSLKTIENQTKGVSCSITLDKFNSSRSRNVARFSRFILRSTAELDFFELSWTDILITTMYTSSKEKKTEI